jgi:ATP-binding cassette subfamily F protein uup
MLPGGVDEYLAHRQEVHQAAARRSPPAPRDRSSAADARVARKDLLRIERRLDRIAAEEQRLHDELAEHAADHVRILELDGRLRALLAERAELEEQWLSAAEAAEG